MRIAQFTSTNIVALLRERTKGGTIVEIIQRSGVSISQSGVLLWVYKGRQDIKNGRVTGYSKFAAKWDERPSHRGGSQTAAELLSEMDGALEILEAN